MSNGTKALIAVGIALVVLVGTCAGGAISWQNDGIELQAATKAQYQANQVAYDAFWKSVQETAQVPAQYKEDFKEILVAEATAKMGPQGSQAMMQWFKERNLVLPPEIYMQVQRMIEAGRADFKRNQNTLLDKQRATEAHRGKWMARTVYRGWFGMDYLEDLKGELAPPTDKDGDGRLTVLDYNIVTSAEGKAAFATGEAAPVNVFNKPK